MRPIWIKIKGLNSFLEPQEIDFQELTGEGLFGIFGPTGSGKSSILDGITLALYGTTARNSTNFIHVSTDKALVDYIFSVKTKEIHTYRVTRGFKRSKEGSIRSDGARFLEILEDREEVLADKVGSVNEKCREVIGLSKEDFFRTVVLPQGKFSEFLKLDGMEKCWRDCSIWKNTGNLWSRSSGGKSSSGRDRRRSRLGPFPDMEKSPGRKSGS